MDKAKLTTYSAIEYLLSDICVDWGICIPPIEAEKIAQSDYLEADEFACMVLAAEGMTPEYEKQWRRKIEKLFVERFGNEISRTEFKQNS